MVAAIYNSFYDLELLKHSANCIRPAVNKIVVVHQNVGFDGIGIGGELLLGKYLEEGVIDSYEIVHPDYLPDNKLEAIIEKRNIGLSMCSGFEYIIPMDNDEFYDPNDIELNVAIMNEFDLQTTYAPIKAYYGGSKYCFTDSYCVPFMYRNDGRKFKRTKTKVLCDPARKMEQGLHSIFDKPMHHMTYLKSTIDRKSLGLRNSANKVLYEEVRSHLANWKEGEDALVFSNNKDGSPCLKTVQLEKSDTTIFNGLQLK